MWQRYKPFYSANPSLHFKNSNKLCGMVKPKDSLAPVVLESWTIRPMKKGVCVEGLRVGDSLNQFWHSSTIVSRISSLLLKTSSGTKYKLVGDMDEKSISDTSAFSMDILKQFVHGFPRKWKSLINNARRRVSVEGSVGKKKKTNKQISEKSAERKSGHLRSVSMVSSRGRSIFRPMMWWANERVYVSPRTSTTEYCSGTQDQLSGSSKEPKRRQQQKPNSYLSRSLENNVESKPETTSSKRGTGKSLKRRRRADSLRSSPRIKRQKIESKTIGLNLKDVGMRDCNVDISKLEADVLITPACVQKKKNALASHDRMTGKCLEDDRNFQYFTCSDGRASDLLSDREVSKLSVSYDDLESDILSKSFSELESPLMVDLIPTSCVYSGKQTTRPKKVKEAARDKSEEDTLRGSADERLERNKNGEIVADDDMDLLPAANLNCRSPVATSQLQTEPAATKIDRLNGREKFTRIQTNAKILQKSPVSSRLQTRKPKNQSLDKLESKDEKVETSERGNSKRRSKVDKPNTIEAGGKPKDSKRGMLEQQGVKINCLEETTNAEKRKVGKKNEKLVPVQVDKPNIVEANEMLKASKCGIIGMLDQPGDEINCLEETKKSKKRKVVEKIEKLVPVEVDKLHIIEAYEMLRDSKRGMIDKPGEEINCLGETTKSKKRKVVEKDEKLVPVEEFTKINVEKRNKDNLAAVDCCLLEASSNLSSKKTKKARALQDLKPNDLNKKAQPQQQKPKQQVINSSKPTEFVEEKNVTEDQVTAIKLPGGKGTLKRQKALKQLVEKNVHGGCQDIFSSTPFCSRVSSQKQFMDDPNDLELDFERFFAMNRSMDGKDSGLDSTVNSTRATPHALLRPNYMFDDKTPNLQSTLTPIMCNSADNSKTRKDKELYVFRLKKKLGRQMVRKKIVNLSQTTSLLKSSLKKNPVTPINANHFKTLQFKDKDSCDEEDDYFTDASNVSQTLVGTPVST